MFYYNNVGVRVLTKAYVILKLINI